MGLFSEFRDFAMKGNVVDMAVGIIIGGAFGTIVSSLVSDVLMPPLGYVMGQVDFSQLSIALPVSSTTAEGKVEPVTIRYGLFINTVIKFIIVAFALFMIIKAMNSARRKQEAAPPPPGPSPTEKVLVEIRDLLARR